MTPSSSRQAYPSALQSRLWKALDGDPATVPEARWVGLGLQVLIIMNVLAVIVETVPGVRETWGAWLDHFEVVSIAVFTIEYLARLWSVPASGSYGASLVGSRLRFAATPLALVDLAVIFPAFLAGFGLDLRVLRALRLFRLFRVIKLVRYVRAVRLIGRVVDAKKDELTVVGAGLLLLLIVSASLLYAAEHEAQPDRFASIPDAMWWAVATLTTVGYGDVYPVTPIGKVLGGFIAVGGIAFFALPAGILGAGFLEVFTRNGEAAGQPAMTLRGSGPEVVRCPHCGADLDVTTAMRDE